MICSELCDIGLNPCRKGAEGSDKPLYRYMSRAEVNDSAVAPTDRGHRPPKWHSLRASVRTQTPKS